MGRNIHLPQPSDFALHLFALGQLTQTYLSLHTKEENKNFPTTEKHEVYFKFKNFRSNNIYKDNANEVHISKGIFFNGQITHTNTVRRILSYTQYICVYTSHSHTYKHTVTHTTGCSTHTCQPICRTTRIS